MFVDTHCHLHDPKLCDVDLVVDEYLRSGVDVAINMACCAKTSEQGRLLSEKYDSVYFGTGCHPSDSAIFDDKEFENIAKLTSHPKCVAVGEIGLDYYWKPFDKEKQTEVFIKQMELASSVNLPISIHSRDATADMLKLLKENKAKLNGGAVMHCFSGSVETAKEILKLGIFISFAGPLTFKNANALLDVAKLVPMDMCLTETDCPYLAPHPLRGTVNGPKNVPIILAKLAELKEKSIEEMASQVMANTKNLFKKIK